MFLVLMLTRGHVPFLPRGPIVEVKLQGKVDGWETDDLVVTVEDPVTKQGRRLVGQIKRTVSVTNSDKPFSETIRSAWLDYSNPRMFSKGRDAMALMTGPLSRVDAAAVPWLLSQARTTADPEEFIRNVQTAKFSPSKAQRKLEVFWHQLRQANGNSDVPLGVLYDFLKHFHIVGGDLGGEDGLVIALLHSHISRFHHVNPQWLWGRAVDVVQTWNQNAGTLTWETIPDDLIEGFRAPASLVIPQQFVPRFGRPLTVNWVHHSSLLALLCFVGSWNENNESDFAVLTGLADMDGATLTQNLKEIINLAQSPLRVQRGVWHISNRVNLLESVANHIIDRDLARYEEYAVGVLMERDPALDMPPEERYMAQVLGKELSHSRALRKGLAEGLALLGTRSQILRHCSSGRGEETAARAVRRLLAGADWNLWATLDKLLPALAEAAPGPFLDAVNEALNGAPSPFDGLLQQQGHGPWGTDYLTGLLWALEVLAWDDTYLIRTCDVLAELAGRASGHMWSSRPIDVIVTILLPWFPQTTASAEKRQLAVQTLVNEHGEVAWDVVLRLLPTHRQTSSGTYKPRWRMNVPTDSKTEVSFAEYWEQVIYYAQMALTLADGSVERLGEMLDHVSSLATGPGSLMGRFLGLLADDNILQLSDDERLPLWSKVHHTIVKHRRHAGADWAIPEVFLAALEKIAAKLAPTSPLQAPRPLFMRGGIDLVDPSLDMEERHRALARRRRDALGEVLAFGGTEAVLKFARGVQFPEDVGRSLAEIADDELDAALLPAQLPKKDAGTVALMGGYVLTRFYDKGWAWADGIAENWNKKYKAKFLHYLPFTSESWERVDRWLSDDDHMYWQHTRANPHQAEGPLQPAVDKLLQYGRPQAALNCMYRMLQTNEPIDVEQCTSALLAAARAAEPHSEFDPHQLVQLVEMLQEHPDVEPDALTQVEWVYLRFLDGHYGAFPRSLHRRLADDPEFYCQIIQLLYRSDKEVVEASVDGPKNGNHRGQIPDGEAKGDAVNVVDPTDTLVPPDEERALAENAWELLRGWDIPPGTRADGTFDPVGFEKWLKQAREICTTSGHLTPALLKIGEMLIHAPTDPEGLWLHHVVASALNAKDAEPMRSGFRTAIFNARGPHIVDSSGDAERRLAAYNRERAKAVENAGYHRLAAALRELADQYDRDAERVAERYRDL